MKRTTTLLSLALMFLAAATTACASSAPAVKQAKSTHTMLHVGEPFETPVGKVFVVRVQDEFRLIRCVPSGPIAGCYEDLAAVAESGVTWNKWTSVPSLPGLDINFLSPQDVAVRLDEAKMLAATTSPTDSLGSGFPVALFEYE